MKKPKLVIVVRTDLEMTTGKIVAQSGHAVAQLMLGERTEEFVNWLGTGMKKVCLQADSEAKILEMAERAEKHEIPFYIVRDAGLTSVPPGTITCIGIGPDKDRLVEKVTGSLKLYD